MIRTIVNIADDDRQLLVLGISERNVEQLKAGRPTYHDMSDMPGLEGLSISIVYGETEVDIVDYLEKEGLEVSEDMREQARRIASD